MSHEIDHLFEKLEVRELVEKLERSAGIRVSLNPTRTDGFLADLNAQFPKSTTDPDLDIRVFLDTQSNLYFWNAYDASHAQVAPKLGLDAKESARARMRFTTKTGQGELLVNDGDLFSYKDRGTIPSANITEATDKIKQIFSGWKFKSGNIFS